MDGLKLDNGYVASGSFDLDGTILKADSPHVFLDTETGELVTFYGRQLDQDPTIMSSSRYEFPDGDIWQTFKQISDVCGYDDHRGFDGLIQDVEGALSDDSLSPSFGVWKNEFLIKARIFNVLTARGNSPDNLERAIRIINNEVLTDEEKEQQLENIAKNFGFGNEGREKLINFYFKEVCDYYPCHNAHFWRTIYNGYLSPAKRKTVVMQNYIVPRVGNIVEGIANRTSCAIKADELRVAQGFSDDSITNIVEMAKWMHQGLPANQKGRLFYSGDQERLPELESQLGGIGTIKQITQSGHTMTQIKI